MLWYYSLNFTISREDDAEPTREEVLEALYQEMKKPSGDLFIEQWDKEEQHDL